MLEDKSTKVEYRQGEEVTFCQEKAVYYSARSAVSIDQWVDLAYSADMSIG